MIKTYWLINTITKKYHRKIYLSKFIPLNSKLMPSKCTPLKQHEQNLKKKIAIQNQTKFVIY